MTDPLPMLPQPAAPVNPACEWCGKRPATRYEVAPAAWTTKRQADARGRVRASKVMKKHPIVAYACRRHVELFDKQKQDIADRKARERAELKA